VVRILSETKAVENIVKLFYLPVAIAAKAGGVVFGKREKPVHFLARAGSTDNLFNRPSFYDKLDFPKVSRSNHISWRFKTPV
jgi:hypothetical protein